MRGQETSATWGSVGALLLSIPSSPWDNRAGGNPLSFSQPACALSSKLQRVLLLCLKAKCLCISCPISSFFPPFHPLLLNTSKQVRLLRPELCIGSKESMVKSHFKTSPSSVWRGRLGFTAELRGALWMTARQGGQEAACCNLHQREMLSAAVADERRAALPSLLAWGRRGVLGDLELAAQIWDWGSPLIVPTSYCCCIWGSPACCFLIRLQPGYLLKQAWASLNASSCWAQRWRPPCCRVPGGRAAVSSPGWGWDWC